MLGPMRMMRRKRKLSGDWLPTDISGCTLWLPADYVSGLEHNDPLTTWEDESGNGNDFSQSTASKKPLYKTNQVNELPAIYFDGSDDGLDCASAVMGSATTVFAVVNVDTCTNATEAVIAQYYDVNGRRTILGYILTDASMAVFQVGGFNFWAGQGPGLDTWRLLQWQKNGAGDVGYRRDGGTLQTDPESNIIDTHETTMGYYDQGGTNEWSNISIAEVIVYNSVLSDSDRDAVETYLGDKYNIAIA